MIRSLILFIALCLPLLAGDEWPPPPCRGGSGKLKAKRNILKRKLLKSKLQFDWPYDFGKVAYASSLLRAEGFALKSRCEDPDDPRSCDAAYEEWSCMYSPGKAFDGSSRTAWSEGVKGPGIGEIIIKPVQLSRPTKQYYLRLFNGYGKSKRHWKTNNRIRELKFHLAFAKEVSEYMNMMSGYTYNKIKYLCSLKVTAKDQFGFQYIKLNPKKCPALKTQSWLKHKRKQFEKSALIIGIEILSVYPGSKYNDTLISEMDLVQQSHYVNREENDKE